MEPARDGLRVRERLGRHDDRRSPRAVVPVQERLRKRAGYDRHAHGVLPRPVVPPLHVTRMKPVVGRAPVGLVAVDEVEPVAPGVEAPREAVDRLDVAAAVSGLHLRGPLERFHRRDAGGNLLHEQHVRSSVTCDPKSGAARPACVAGRAAATGDRGHDDSRDRTPHPL